MTIDVTDIITDPDFAVGGAVGPNSLTYTRQVKGGFVDGVQVIAPGAPVPFYGVVCVDDATALIRMPDGQRFAAQIRIQTLTALVPGAANASADIVTWQGVAYTVTAVGNYSHMGIGFYDVVCDLLPVGGV